MNEDHKVAAEDYLVSSLQFVEVGSLSWGISQEEDCKQANILETWEINTNRCRWILRGD